MGDIDISQRNVLGIVTVPNLPGFFTLSQVTISANSTRSFAVTTTPQGTNLQLWNFLFSLAIDAPTANNITDEDSSGNFMYILPVGTSLTAGQLLVIVDHWIDWAQSSDATNKRVGIIRIHNTDSISHTYYLMYKAYTFSNAAVTVAGSGGGGAV